MFDYILHSHDIHVAGKKLLKLYINQLIFYDIDCAY